MWHNQIWLCWPPLLPHSHHHKHIRASYDFKTNHSFVLQVFGDTNTKVSIKLKIWVLTMLLQVLGKHHRQKDMNQGLVKGRVNIHTATATNTSSDNGDGSNSNRYDSNEGGVCKSSTSTSGSSDGVSRSKSSSGSSSNSNLLPPSPLISILFHLASMSCSSCWYGYPPIKAGLLNPFTLQHMIFWNCAWILKMRLWNLHGMLSTK